MPTLHDTLTISITRCDGISPVFIRANGALLKKHHKLIAEQTDTLKSQLIEELWLQEYRAKLDRDSNNIWCSMQFKNRQDMSMFMLKWSN